MLINDVGGLGRIEVTRIPLPEFVKNAMGTYTYSGKVNVIYVTENDPKVDDYYNIAVLNDDGSDFKVVFSGVIKRVKRSNGIRVMPYQDNKRVLLGDYVLEYSPDIDNCEKTELVPVEYPISIMDDPNTMAHWSEIIISPDNEYIGWTSLRSDTGAANFLGRLVREKDKYVIKDTQIISSIEYIANDTTKDGYIKPLTRRGGEIKQFVRGGAAISLCGGGGRSLLSVSSVEDFNTGEVTYINKVPGYEETTMFSPDERLGVAMSTRGSPMTNSAVLDLLPVPYGSLASSGIILAVYMYAVSAVRAFRPGNVGPVLIDIKRAMGEEGYRGVLLNDPGDEWVYYSPISWHPGSVKAMWNEGQRGRRENKRLMIAKLLDYKPGAAVPIVKTPTDISYGVRDLSVLRHGAPVTGLEGKIAGKHSGYMQYARSGAGMECASEAAYHNFSDDGKRFYNGFIRSSSIEETILESDIEMTGEECGEMKLRVTFSKTTLQIGGQPEPTRVLFENAEDGKPKSYGHAEYKGIRLNVRDVYYKD